MSSPFRIGALVYDLIGASRADVERGVQALGWSSDIFAPDPAFEEDFSASRPLRRRDEDRTLVIDDVQDAQFDARVARDRLIALTEATGARLGRLYRWGEVLAHAIAARTPRDLAGVALLDDALTIDVLPSGSPDFEGHPDYESFNAARLKRFQVAVAAVTDEAVMNAIFPARAMLEGDLLVVDTLDPITGVRDETQARALLRRICDACYRAMG